MPDIALTSPDNGASMPGQWVSVSELASIKGLTRQSLSERVTRLEGQGLINTRPGKGKTKLVNLAEFDRAVGEVSDLSKASGAATKRISEDPPEAPAPTDSSAATYTREQARQKGYQADLARLELEERLGKLIPAAQVETSAIAFGEVLVRLLDQIHLRAEDNAAAVAKDGVTGSRAWLKDLARDLRGRFADELGKLAAGGTPEAPFASPGDENTADDQDDA